MSAAADKSRAVAHYQALAAQAQTQARTLDASIGRDVFLEELIAGRDTLFNVNPGGRLYKLSSFLGECDKQLHPLLFSACHGALSGRDAAEVVAELAAFARAVATEYGNDSEECWSDEADELDGERGL